MSAAPLSSSSEPAPANDPENVVLAPPETASRVEASVGPTMTVPPPESEPISTVAASPSASVAPALTLKAGVKAEAFEVPAVIVKVAALPIVNE